MSGYHDVDGDFTQDPGEPGFEASLANPCAEPPVPGGSVTGAADIVLFQVLGSPRVRLSIDARSGPVGQSPAGTVLIATPDGEVTGTVTCVSVKGALATVGVRLDRALPGGVSAALIDIADYSSVPNSGLEDFVAFTPVASAPSQCAFPLSPNLGYSEASNGTFIVAPAPALPTSQDQCKAGGWQSFPGFKNQGQCVSFVQRGAKA